MPINHFSSDLPETLWWPPPPPPSPSQRHHPYHHHHHLIMEPNPNPSSSKNPNNPFISNPKFSWPPNLYHQHHPMFSTTTQNPTLNFNLNNLEDDADELLQDTDSQQSLHQQQQQEEENCEAAVVKEFMFKKPLTPSDVGKLNRLVIPKQHAEKYFPFGADSVDKGLLLSFEDELGKCWRFRYSYWNSSQSYVLTKGWSRYVKEKQLDAGDVVLFERHRAGADDGERLFIGWRRRGDDSNSGGMMMVQGSSGGVWSRGLYSSSSSSPGHQAYQHGHGANVTSTVAYQPECLLAGSGGGQNQITQLGNSKRLRLFGVNMECQLDQELEPSTPDGSSLSSQQGPTQQHFYSFHHSTSYSSSSNNTHSHMDTSFSRDGKQMRNSRG